VCNLVKLAVDGFQSSGKRTYLSEQVHSLAGELLSAQGQRDA
jgi:hypothetical protein